ncbi:MAG: hypothetical protein AAGI23_10605 [Bacteroidota bacterium]
MDPLYIFEADNSKETLQLILAAVASIAFLGALIYLKRTTFAEDKRHLQKTGIMLMGFALTISVGSIFGIVWNLKRLAPVEVYSNKVISSFGEVPYEELRAVYLHTGHNRSIVSPSIELDTTKLAYFEERAGKSYVFSSDQYDAEGIVRAIRPLLDEQQGRERME